MAADPTGGGGGGPSFSLSSSTFSNLGGAVNDLFSADMGAKGLRIKAAGQLAEAQNYDLAAALAGQNKAFTEQSTRIKEMQQEREAALQMGEQRGAVASSGFAMSGSALDILRDSAGQAALQHQVLGQQGLITEAGFEEQAKSFETMAASARATAAGEEDLAREEKTSGTISAIFKGAAAVASVAAAPFTAGTSLAALPAIAAAG